MGKTWNIKHSWVRQGGDYEIYRVAGKFVLVVWGYAAQPDDCTVHVWQGEPTYTAEELPLLAEDGGTHWVKNPAGCAAFSFAVDEDGNPDWFDYSEKVDAILDEIEAYYSNPRPDEA